MPSPLPTSLPRGGIATALCRAILALLHLSVVVTAYAAQQTLAMTKPISRPYLSTISAPAMRFAEAMPRVPVLIRPIASGPPVAATAPEVAEVTLANNEAAASTPPIPTQLPIETPHPVAQPEAVQPATVSNAQPILPDSTRKKVQSQDFLPLFRFPGSASSLDDVTVISPAVPASPVPGTLPQSSATYRQY